MSNYSDIPPQLILVVDDSRTISSMVASRLERSGYEVITSADGEAALQLAVERRPALVILDVEMPELNGFEVTRRLRAHEPTSGIPIVLLTAHGEQAAVEAGYAAGATGYVTKPFSPQELEAEVERILGRR